MTFFFKEQFMQYLGITIQITILVHIRHHRTKNVQKISVKNLVKVNYFACTRHGYLMVKIKL